MSAVPSFFWGCAIHSDWDHISAMLLGVTIFILLYTTVECSAIYRRATRHRMVRRTLMIGYGTRLAISIIFPIGMFADIYTGIVAVALIEGQVLKGDGPTPSFLAVLLTTLVQGILVNLVLFGYMFIVFGVQWCVAKLFRPNGTVDTTPQPEA